MGRDAYTAVVRKVGEWYVATCDEIPELTAQGRTPDSCLKHLQAAISASIRDRRPGRRRTDPETPVRVVERPPRGRLDRLA